MSLLNIGKPSPAQLIHGAERTLAVAVVAFVGVLVASNYTLNKVTVTAAALAASTAVWQLVVSTLTNL